MSLHYRFNAFLKHLERPFETFNRIEVSGNALRHNLQFFRDTTQQSVIPVLKGNAYGHGTALVARALKHEKLDYIAVDSYADALIVREETKHPVLIMGAVHPDNFPLLRFRNFAFVVQDKHTITALGKTGKRIKIHLEVNTGMNRNGVRLQDLKALVRHIGKYKNLKLEGIMSHLADSDGDDPALTNVNNAVDVFDRAVETVRAAGAHPTLLHVAQTAGSMSANSRYSNAVRVGIGLYGINPLPKSHRLHNTLTSLQPALRLVSRLVRIGDLKKGEHVSYNYTYTAKKDTRIGVLPLGYYEGVARSLSNVGSVGVNGRHAPIIGRVCMNHTLINLGTIPAKWGDEVVVYSNDASDPTSIASLQQSLGIFSYEILANLSHEVRRVLVD